MMFDTDEELAWTRYHRDSDGQPLYRVYPPFLAGVPACLECDTPGSPAHFHCLPREWEPIVRSENAPDPAPAQGDLFRRCRAANYAEGRS